VYLTDDANAEELEEFPSPTQRLTDDAHIDLSPDTPTQTSIISFEVECQEQSAPSTSWQSCHTHPLWYQTSKTSPSTAVA
jgi:hypothetical protein